MDRNNLLTSDEAAGYMIIAAGYDGLGFRKVNELKELMEIFMDIRTKKQAESVYRGFQNKIMEESK